MDRTLLTGVTLTGVDHHTDLAAALALAARFRFVEWGVLYSPSRAGQGGRYPCVETALSFLDACAAQGVSTAVHLCGQGVFGALDGSDADALALVQRAGRVQLNFNQRRHPVDLSRVDAFAEQIVKPVITQHNGANADVYLVLASPFHQVLFDASGGRGIRPDRWPTALPGKACGYAGSLGPGGLAETLDCIAGAAGDRPYWIDMETSLRNADDRFDLALCEQVLDEAAGWRAG